MTAYQILDHVQQEDGDRSTYAILHASDPCLAHYTVCLGYDHIAAWNTTVHNFSQELDFLSNPGGPLDWIGGFFVLQQTSHQFVAEFGGATPPDPGRCCDPAGHRDPDPPHNLNYGNDSHATHEAYAAFLQGTYHFTDNFRLTAGGRYNMDHNKDPSFNFNAFGSAHALTELWNAVPTWRVEADYDVTHDNMLYVSNARGYKPGGVNGLTGAFLVKTCSRRKPTPRSNWVRRTPSLTDSLRINVSAFYYIHKNYQYIETDPVPFDGGIANIPSVHDYGVEFEGSYVGLDDRLRI